MSHSNSAPLNTLEVELVELLNRHGTDEKLINEYVVRMRAVIAIQKVAQAVGRALNQAERKRAHVQHMAGKSVHEIVALLSK